MIFKVFYQKTKDEAPIRENTETLFIEADSERDVRKKLADRHYNIEYVQKVSDTFLEYEKQQSEQFEVER